MNARTSDDLDINDIWKWGEIGCWIALGMAPIIWWLQGPSVSNDQFVVRTGLVVICAVGAIGLRIRGWMHSLAARQSARSDGATEPSGIEP